MRIDRRCNLNIQCLGPNNLPAPILSIDRRNSIKEKEWRNTYGEFILFRIDSRYISRYVIQNSSGEIVGGPLFYSSRSRFTAIRFFTGREIKRFSLPSSLLSPHAHPFTEFNPFIRARSCDYAPGRVSMLSATLSEAFSFTSPLSLSPPHNNEVTVLNVSRTGDHREWGAKSPSTVSRYGEKRQGTI